MWLCRTFASVLFLQPQTICFYREQSPGGHNPGEQENCSEWDCNLFTALVRLNSRRQCCLEILIAALCQSAARIKQPDRETGEKTYCCCIGEFLLCHNHRRS